MSFSASQSIRQLRHPLKFRAQGLGYLEPQQQCLPRYTPVFLQDCLIKNQLLHIHHLVISAWDTSLETTLCRVEVFISNPRKCNARLWLENGISTRGAWSGTLDRRYEFWRPNELSSPSSQEFWTIKAEQVPRVLQQHVCRSLSGGVRGATFSTACQSSTHLSECSFTFSGRSHCLGTFHLNIKKSNELALQKWTTKSIYDSNNIDNKTKVASELSRKNFPSVDPEH